MDPIDIDVTLMLGALAIRAHRFVRGFALMYAGFLTLALLLLTPALWPGDAMDRARLLLLDALHGGLAALVLSSLLLAALALAAALFLTSARQRVFEDEDRLTGMADARERRLAMALAKLTPSIMARQGQAVLLPLGAILIGGLCWGFYQILTFQPHSPDGNLGAGFAILVAFPSLIAERMMAGFPVAQLPEAPSLRRILLFATVMLGLAGLMEIGRSVGLGWLEWPIRLLVWAPALVAAELGLRGLARYFAPAPAGSAARAATDSILLTLATSGPRAPGDLLREHFGLDFARSWALAYLRSAAISAVLITALFCWGLSGLKLIAFDERGVYERLGAPAGVLGPGLHLLLPWPLGRLRPVEFGQVHTIVAGLDHEVADIEPISAEAAAPSSMNRLWETINPTEVEYLVASESSSQQGFQAVSAEVRVLYRTGLTDPAALQAVYGVANQETLVKIAAGKVATQFFASHTLDAVMGARRDQLEDTMRSQIADDLAAQKAGIEVVAVVIEAIHPPAGAAQAYHAVQAAEINADASISDETARAEHTLGTAQQEAAETLDVAQASATETKQRANADAYRFGADIRSAGLDRSAFLLDYRFSHLVGALASRHLIIMDDHLDSSQEPLIDVRPAQGGGSAPLLGLSTAPRGPASLTTTPGTSTEGTAPPITTEQANEEARQAQQSGGNADKGEPPREPPPNPR